VSSLRPALAALPALAPSAAEETGRGKVWAAVEAAEADARSCCRTRGSLPVAAVSVAARPSAGAGPAVASSDAPRSPSCRARVRLRAWALASGESAAASACRASPGACGEAGAEEECRRGAGAAARCGERRQAMTAAAGRADGERAVAGPLDAGAGGGSGRRRAITGDVGAEDAVDAPGARRAAAARRGTRMSWLEYAPPAGAGATWSSGWRRGLPAAGGVAVKRRRRGPPRMAARGRGGGADEEPAPLRARWRCFLRLWTNCIIRPATTAAASQRRRCCRASGDEGGPVPWGRGTGGSVGVGSSVVFSSSG
jgi:hypothetical protein